MLAELVSLVACCLWGLVFGHGLLVLLAVAVTHAVWTLWRTNVLSNFLRSLNVTSPGRVCRF